MLNNDKSYPSLCLYCSLSSISLSLNQSLFHTQTRTTLTNTHTITGHKNLPQKSLVSTFIVTASVELPEERELNKTHLIALPLSVFKTDHMQCARYILAKSSIQLIELVSINILRCVSTHLSNIYVHMYVPGFF